MVDVTFVSVVAQVVAVVALLHLVTLYAVGSWRRPFSVVRPVRHSLRAIRENIGTVGPTAAVLGVVLALNGFIRDLGVELSWLIGMNITGYIHAFEGAFVVWAQSFASPPLTAYFSGVYVYGYVFLLTFPLVLYAAHKWAEPLHATLVAYALNYTLGLLFYVAFVSYGPRNFMPEAVESLLFTTWPQAQLLTSQVNENTNVFPSLHTSLSMTVAFLAYYYRAVAPRWLPIAGVLALSITASTMYLGIHWLSDVLGGIVLAAGCVVAGIRTAENRLPTKKKAEPSNQSPSSQR